MFTTNSITANHENILEMFKLIDRSIDAMTAEMQTLAGQNNVGTAAYVAQITKMLQKLNEDVSSVRKTYFVGVSTYIVAHGLLMCDAKSSSASELREQEDSIRAAYIEFIGEKNVIGTIDRCIETVTSMLRAFSVKLDSEHERELKEITSALENADRLKVTLAVERVTSGDCECGGEFVMYAESNERKCNTCGMTATIWDSAVDDMNIYSQELHKAKQNRHHPIQHCKTWVARIQAWHVPNIPESVFTDLRLCLARDNATNLKNISCKRIRKYLKDEKLTAYNNYVPLIRKKLTGIAPPQLTQDELTRLYETFTQVSKILLDMRPDNNINYYPVFIFKILDEQLPLGSRKVQIMECIHLQSENTVKVIDNLYAQVCARMGRTDKPRPINWGEYKKLL